MKYSEIHEGKKYRITYKETKARRTHWDNGLLPQAGTVVEVNFKSDRAYSFYSIMIQDKEGIPFHCKANDLVKYEKETY